MSYEMMRAYTDAERETMARESKVVITLRELDPTYRATVKIPPVISRISRSDKDER